MALCWWGANSVEAAASTSVSSAITPYRASVVMASMPDGKGSWVAGIDGGVFTFGDAQFYGSVPRVHATIGTVG